MTAKPSSNEIRHYNTRQIFQALIHDGASTKQELASKTQLSIPTVTQVLSDLAREGLVLEDGIRSSSGGRRPAAYAPVPQARLAAGMDVTRHHIHFSVMDLSGKMIASERIQFSVPVGPDFCNVLYEKFMQFLGERSVSYNSLSGLGVSLPGIIAVDNRALAYSHVLGTELPLNLEPLRRRLQIPVRFFNDANAACLAECYVGRVPFSSFSFVSLSNTVGGALVIDGKLVTGNHNRCGEVGHILVHPGGRPCYCGCRGHYDPYGSALILSNPAGGSLERFFERLEAGDERFREIFDDYLSHLALLCANLRVWSDLPIVLGGYTASYLSPWLDELYRKIEALSIFRGESDYLFLSSFRYEASAVGCADYFIRRFLDGM